MQRDGKVYRQEFARGEPTSAMKAIGDRPRTTGTTISFLPDLEIFEELEWSRETLVQRAARDGVPHARAADRRSSTSARARPDEFHYEGGIRDFVAYVNESKDPLHKHIVYFEGETDLGTVEVAMQWNASYVESVFSFANNINTHEGGSHLSGFKARAHRHAQQATRASKGLLKEKEENLEGEDVREGLAAVISVKLRDPQFEGQTKTKLGNPWVRGLVEQTVNQQLAEFLEENPHRRAPDRPEGDRGRARAPGGPQGARAHARKSALEGGSLPGQARRLPERAIPRSPSSTSSRATPPAAPRRTRATAPTRRSSRCAAR